MSDIGMSWGMVSAALVLAAGLGLALFWQSMRRKEAHTHLQACKDQLEQLQALGQSRELELRELTAAVRAEKAHVEQLQRQLSFAHEESAGLRDEQKQLLTQLADLLREDDAEAVELLERHSAALSARPCSHMAPLEAAIHNYEFEQALTIAEKWIEDLTP